MTCFAVIAGGGTSGHVLPALSIAESLMDAGHAVSDIVYFGAQRGIETVLVPPSGLPHEFFDVVGFKRELTFSAIANNIAFLPKLVAARRRAIARFRTLRPQIVVSVGGYASLPAVLAARSCGVPVVVVSYDRRPGRSSELAARRAARCAVAYPESDLPRAVWTGAPVRRDIRRLDRSAERSAARRSSNLADDAFVIGVVGGSLGSGVLNDAIIDYAREHRGDRNLVILHVVGQRFYDAVVGQATNDPHGLEHRVVAYENDMVTMYSAIDLLVGRGGAGTVAEVATVGVPAVLVPWAAAADDHQTENVKWLSDAGGAVLLEESAVKQSLGQVIDRLRSSPSELEEIARAAWKLGEVNRSNRIAEVIDEVVKEFGRV